LKALPGQILTPAAVPGTGHLGNKKSSLSITFNLNHPIDPSVTL
jgi:hypothetical protein